MNYINDDVGNIALISSHKLSRFPKPGFYDYKIVEINEEGKSINNYIIRNNN